MQASAASFFSFVKGKRLLICVIRKFWSTLWNRNYTYFYLKFTLMHYSLSSVALQSLIPCQMQICCSYHYGQVPKWLEWGPTSFWLEIFKFGVDYTRIWSEFWNFVNRSKNFLIEGKTILVLVGSVFVFEVLFFFFFFNFF